MKLILITLTMLAAYLALNACAMVLTWFANHANFWCIIAVIFLIILTIAHQRSKTSKIWNRLTNWY